MTRRHDNAQQNLKEAASVTAASGLAEVSGTLRSIATARRPDHIDEYTLATRVAATPDQWAKALFEDSGGRKAQLIWRRLLRMHLQPRGAQDTIAGWPIEARGENWIRLRASGALLSCELIVRTDSGAVQLSTVVTFVNRRGAAIWRSAAAFHARASKDMLHEAAADFAEGSHATGVGTGT